MLDREKHQAIPDPILIADLETATDFTQEEHKTNIDSFSSQVANRESTFELLWALFVPNCLVYRYHELTEQPQILQFRSAKMRKRMSGSLYLDFRCNIVADDGLQFGLAEEPLEMEIDDYDATRKIQDLPFYPLEYVDDRESLMTMVIERGRDYASLEGSIYRETNGVAMHEKMNENWKVKQFKFRVRTLLQISLS